jgi:2-keto-4-pentenoate hydratase/2-oxohepta-3-ene-1,7-dioic acid hydratase in catechol pathway
MAQRGKQEAGGHRSPKDRQQRRELAIESRLALGIDMRKAVLGSGGSSITCPGHAGGTARAAGSAKEAREHHMKLLYFDDFKLGVLKGDNTVVDVSAVVRDIPHTGPGDLMNGLIERFSSYRAKLEAAAASGHGVALASVRIRPPLPKPNNIDCMAVNYMEDGTRSAPAPINAFNKSASAIIGNGDTMVLPDVPAAIFEGEAEMAVIIGKRATNVSAANAMDYVFGYTNFVDGSARGLPPPGNVFFQMKSRDTFAPMGPWIVTADEIKDPHKLQIRLWTNGQLMQNFNTDDMGHKIPRCIEWLTSIHTLEPGDVIASGTNHRGLNPFMDGDKVELETEGLGRLTFSIKDELKRKWERKTRLQMHEAAAQKTPGNYPDFTPQTAGKHAKA